MEKAFDTIYAMSSTGKVKMWSARVYAADDKVFMEITHGYSDGKKQVDTKEIKEGKNIGKSNETTTFDQAVSEAQSKMNKKTDEGYTKEIPTGSKDTTLLPMLALKFQDREADIVYPCFVQPKLNGVRCLKVGDTYMSRKGKPFTTLAHMDTDTKLFNEFVGCYADGEVFSPDMNFQEVIRAVKKYRDGVSEQLQYWIYDIVNEDKDFLNRTHTIQNFFDRNKNATVNINGIIIRKFNNLIEVPTHVVQTKKELMEWHKKFTEAGFEGTIIRNYKGGYVLKHRSKNLQKYKDFIDAEYKIVGCHEGTGNDIGTVIFECVTNAGTIFSVRPRGSRELRREWLKDIDKIKGKELTIRYQNLSEDGVPIFPVGLAIRDYE